MSFLLAAVPITLALVRVFPNAVTLGAAAEAGPAEAALARTILGDHLFCLASIVGFLTVRLAIARAPRG